MLISRDGDTIYYPVCFWIALGFTIFSICSVAFKLKGKINAFPIFKCIAYVAILVVILVIGRKYVGNRYPGYVSLNENGVTVPEMQGDAFVNRKWNLRMETEDGWYDIVFLDNAELEGIYKNYDIDYKELVYVSPCLGYVKEEDPPVNPVVRWWSIPQEQYDDLIILLKSIVPDKLPSNGYGFEEWR